MLSLQVAQGNAKGAIWTSGDAHHLPFPDGSVDISFFHFVLLWLADPIRALGEARRATRDGGAVIAFAEPDYSQRVATTSSLARIGQLQADSLYSQGANPNLGSQLEELFVSAGIQPIEVGELLSDPSLMKDESIGLELETLKSDLAKVVPARELDQLMDALQETKESLVTFQVPTFYCWAWVN